MKLLPMKHKLGILLMLVAVPSLAQFVPMDYVPGGGDPGQVVSSATNAEETVEVRFIQNAKGFHMMELRIINHSDQETFVDVASMFARFSDERPEPEGEMRANRVYAVTREQYAAAIEERQRRAATTANVLMLLSVAAVVYDGVRDVQDSRKEFWTRNDQARSDIRDGVAIGSMIASDIAGDQAHRETFGYAPAIDDLFTDSPIGPGQDVSGLICIPNQVHTRYMRVHVSTAAHDYVFDFRRGRLKH